MLQRVDYDGRHRTFLLGPEPQVPVTSLQQRGACVRANNMTYILRHQLSLRIAWFARLSKSNS